MLHPLAILAAAGSLVTLAGCDDSGSLRDQIRVVGSSTVYPFTTAVAERYARKHPDARAPIVEATGTGAGLKLFCAGVGARFPDIADASRRIRPAELADCRAHGVTRIVEVPIGIDGIALGQSVRGPRMMLTEGDVYRALAARPFGAAQAARTWADVDPTLPATRIAVYGPPPTSGTRDAFADLVLTKGCETNAATKALPEGARGDVCTKLREDGAYVEAGENDNLIVQKLAANPQAIGIFGYASLAENADAVRGLPLQGVAPGHDAIASFRYPGARPLYLYVKAAHVDVIPGLRAFLAEYAGAWGPDGYLARRGLIASPAAVQARAREIAMRLVPLDAAQAR